MVGSFVEAHCWSVPRLPGADESQRASAYVRECAGKGLAVALGAHRLGATVDLLMAVGHDAAGDAALQLLERDGLPAAHVHRLGAHSAHGCGLLGADGETSVTVFTGANDLLGAQQLQPVIPCLHHAAVAYAQCEAPLALVADALHAARRAGVLTVLNPSPWPAEGMRSAVGAQALAAADVLVVNRSEALPLLSRWVGEHHAWTQEEGMSPALESLPALVLHAVWRQWAGRWLIITLGAQGCVAYGRDDSVVIHQPSHPVRSVQPIGAGDAFSAGLCTALAEGQSMASALALANVCGALAASRNGILTTLPQRVEVDAFVAQEQPVQN
ncbi:PfkB family carbohydrate kinase [Diaphorobacter caeni]|uniref:PfkB family carbohydrate kinase n=1 Tax=Diaphorobacter caeni TaxID=2784387 RepID=UPI00188F7BFF|nr:PfkB family carbohydrate kinase [Diaphorobacter caeni]MBF5006041.1 hypothetical protein [Diaphorobacter caeni]